MKILNQLKTASLFLFVTSSLAISAQETPSNNIIQEINSPLPNTYSSERNTYLVQFDSSINTQFDVNTGQWNVDNSLHHTYHANGKLHTTVRYFFNEKNVDTYDSDGKQILFERFEDNGFGWDPIQQSDYYYNTNDQLIEVIANVYNQGQWLPANNYKLTYTASGETEQELFQFYNGTSWENSSVNIYSYDSNGNLDTLSYYYFTNGVQEKNSRIVQTFDQNNNLLDKQNYLAANGNWVPYIREINVYNSNNKIVSQNRYGGSGANWANTDSSHFQYAINGQLTVQNGYYFSNQNWEPAFLDSSVFNTNDDLVSFKRQFYANGTFINEQQRLNTYNSAFEQTKLEQYNWNISSNSWDNAMKMEYEQIIQGEFTVRTIYSGSGTTWEPSVKEERNFDFDVKNTEVQGNPYELGSKYKWDSYNSYNYDNGVWIHTALNTHYYTDLNTSVSSLNQVEISLYPNPAHDQIQITSPSKTLKNIQIMNVNGQIISEINNSKTSNLLDISNLPNGQYIVRLVENGQMSTTKFVKY